MPHASLKLIPGVNTNKTPALNEAGISETNLIRFVPDGTGAAIAQKLGGWTQYSGFASPSPVWALHPWSDLSANHYIGVGARTGIFYGQPDDGVFADISPQSSTVEVACKFSVSEGSNIVNVYDPGSNVTKYDGIYIESYVSVGGVIIFGYYQCIPLSANEYQIIADNVIGVPTPYTPAAWSMTAASWTTGTAKVTVDGAYDVTVGSKITVSGVSPSGYNGTNLTVTASTKGPTTTTISYAVAVNPGAYVSGGTVTLTDIVQGGSTALLETVSGSRTVTVTLPGNTFSVGQAFTILQSTTVGGVTLYGDYTIDEITDVENGKFTIVAPNQASSTASGYVGNDIAQIKYVYGAGALPTSSGYGNGAYGAGGYGKGVTSSGNRSISVSGATWSGGTATVTTSTGYDIPVGSTVKISGINPSGYNGAEITVTASTSNTISYAVGTNPGAYVSGGTVQVINWDFGTTIDWCLDNWGEYLIASPASQPISFWNPENGSNFASVVPNSPPVNEGCFVAMPERQIIAYGSSFTGIQDPLLVRWCDIGNFTSWAGTVTNQAGSYRLPTGSKIVGGMQGPQQGLLWTDVGIWSMQYISLPYVWSFNEIGNGCGLISKKAAGKIAGAVYWMSQSQFFVLSSGGVQVVPCPIWDMVFQDINTDQLDLIRCAVNSRFNEISWFYPPAGSSIPSKYVKYNVVINTWDYGNMIRSAWTDQSILGSPIGAGISTSGGVTYPLYQHETSNDADGKAMNSYLTTGYFALQEGDILSFVDQVWPDMKWATTEQVQSGPNAQVNMTIYSAKYAGDGPNAQNDFTILKGTQYVSPRLRGRLMAFKIGSDDVGSFWRIGNIRYRIQTDGKY